MPSPKFITKEGFQEALLGRKISPSASGSEVASGWQTFMVRNILGSFASLNYILLSHSNLVNTVQETSIIIGVASAVTLHLAVVSGKELSNLIRAEIENRF